MKAKIQDRGYVVNGIYIELEETEEFEIKRLNLSISKKENEVNEEGIFNTINKIEEINIQVQINNNIQETEHLIDINNNEIEEIKDYINSTYEINKKIIHINE